MNDDDEHIDSADSSGFMEAAVAAEEEAVPDNEECGDTDDSNERRATPADVDPEEQEGPSAATQNSCGVEQKATTQVPAAASNDDNRLPLVVQENAKGPGPNSTVAGAVAAAAQLLGTMMAKEATTSSSNTNTGKTSSPSPTRQQHRTSAAHEEAHGSTFTTGAAVPAAMMSDVEAYYAGEPGAYAVTATTINDDDELGHSDATRGGEESVAAHSLTIPNAVLVEEEESHKVVPTASVSRAYPEPDALVLSRRKIKQCLLTGLVAFLLLATAVILRVELPDSSDQKAHRSVTVNPSMVPSHSPSTAPSGSPSVAPTIDYVERINDYGFITNFAAVLSMDTPQDCSSTAQPRGWEVRIQATCLDGSSNDDFGADSMIYQIGSSHSESLCVRLDSHVMQCDITLQEHAMHHTYNSGFACGTNSGNATMEFSVEPLYETSHCQLTGDMASNLQAMCEIGDFILSPFCSTANLTTVEERCTFPEEGTKKGLYTTLNVPNSTCAALNLESSFAFRLRAVLWPRRRN